MKNRIFATALVFVIALLTSVSVMANKTSVTIEAPKEAKIGSEITITINVKHIGNSAAHFTDWVQLKINGEVVKKWIYTKKSLPTAQNFTLSFTFVVTGDLKIEAEGHCNLHGSEGIAAASVTALK